jgi:hypothetical protein
LVSNTPKLPYLLNQKTKRTEGLAGKMTCSILDMSKYGMPSEDVQVVVVYMELESRNEAIEINQKSISYVNASEKDFYKSSANIKSS